MKYNRLGRTGLFVSELGFGTMTFGEHPGFETLGGVAQGEAHGTAGAVARENHGLVAGEVDAAQRVFAVMYVGRVKAGFASRLQAIRCRASRSAAGSLSTPMTRPPGPVAAAKAGRSAPGPDR